MSLLFIGMSSKNLKYNGLIFLLCHEAFVSENLSHRTQAQPFFDMDKLKKFVHEKVCPYGQNGFSCK